MVNVRMPEDMLVVLSAVLKLCTTTLIGIAMAQVVKNVEYIFLSQILHPAFIPKIGLMSIVVIEGIKSTVTDAMIIMGKN